jgi:hypothetical protein
MNATGFRRGHVVLLPPPLLPPIMLLLVRLRLRARSGGSGLGGNVMAALLRAAG